MDAKMEMLEAQMRMSLQVQEALVLERKELETEKSSLEAEMQLQQQAAAELQEVRGRSLGSGCTEPWQCFSEQRREGEEPPCLCQIDALAANEIFHEDEGPKIGQGQTVRRGLPGQVLTIPLMHCAGHREFLPRDVLLPRLRGAARGSWMCLLAAQPA